MPSSFYISEKGDILKFSDENMIFFILKPSRNNDIKWHPLNKIPASVDLNGYQATVEHKDFLHLLEEVFLYHGGLDGSYILKNKKFCFQNIEILKEELGENSLLTNFEEDKQQLINLLENQTFLHKVKVHLSKTLFPDGFFSQSTNSSNASQQTTKRCSIQ